MIFLKTIHLMCNPDVGAFSPIQTNSIQGIIFIIYLGPSEFSSSAIDSFYHLSFSLHFLLWIQSLFIFACLLLSSLFSTSFIFFIEQTFRRVFCLVCFNVAHISITLIPTFFHLYFLWCVFRLDTASPKRTISLWICLDVCVTFRRVVVQILN